MKIRRLLINNFRGIAALEVGDLGDTVVVAGQNGSGKSCIFDAIRLLKSTYGGYQQNEWQQFFGELHIQLSGGGKHLKNLFNDQSKSAVIEIDFQIRDRERLFVTHNVVELLEQTIWQELVPEAFQFGGYKRSIFAQQLRHRQPEVDEIVKQRLPKIMAELARSKLLGRIEIYSDGRVDTTESHLLEVLFSNYRPRQIGVIDFHGAQRHYGRENVQGINLNLDQTNQQSSHHTLYNYNNKYNNVKSEMAGGVYPRVTCRTGGGGRGSSRGDFADEHAS